MICKTATTSNGEHTLISITFWHVVDAKWTTSLLPVHMALGITTGGNAHDGGYWDAFSRRRILFRAPANTSVFAPYQPVWSAEDLAACRSASASNRAWNAISQEDFNRA